jgi:hypothetical protein
MSRKYAHCNNTGAYVCFEINRREVPFINCLENKKNCAYGFFPTLQPFFTNSFISDHSLASYTRDAQTDAQSSSCKVMAIVRL